MFLISFVEQMMQSGKNTGDKMVRKQLWKSSKVSFHSRHPVFVFLSAATSSYLDLSSDPDAFQGLV